MNIFHLSKDPRECAEFLGDKHCVKMVLETAQMLSTACHHVEYYPEGIYKPSHQNHPMTIWVRSDAAHFLWTFDLYTYLLEEYTFRRDKVHKSASLIDSFLDHPFCHLNWDAVGKMHPPPLCMPEEFHRDDYVEAYRLYYAHKYRQGIVQYNWGREMPGWLEELIS